MKKNLLALFLLSTISSSYAASDLFSAVGGLIDTGTDVVKSVTGDSESSNQPKLSKSELKLIEMCKEFNKNSIMAKKKYIGSDITATGKYYASDDIVTLQSVSFATSAMSGDYSVIGDGPIVHPEWNNDDIHTLTGKLESVKTEFQGCTFHITNVR